MRKVSDSTIETKVLLIQTFLRKTSWRRNGGVWEQDNIFASTDASGDAPKLAAGLCANLNQMTRIIQQASPPQ
jgi:hypothetical protein